MMVECRTVDVQKLFSNSCKRSLCSRKPPAMLQTKKSTLPTSDLPHQDSQPPMAFSFSSSIQTSLLSVQSSTTSKAARLPAFAKAIALEPARRGEPRLVLWSFAQHYSGYRLWVYLAFLKKVNSLIININ